MEKLELLHSVVKRNINVIEQELGSVALFGAVGGSISLNLDNQSSDADFYLIVEGDRQKKVVKKTILLEGIQIDFMCVELKDALRDTRDFARQYPTCFYRTLDEQEEIKKMKDVARPDFINDMVRRIFMSDVIVEFKKGIVQEYYNELKKELSLIEIWNCQFIRAYGNYYESIKDKKEVLLRKYLYTVYEIITSEFMMQSKKKFPSNFLTLLDLYFGETDEIKEICIDLVNINKVQVAGKLKKYVPSNTKLNEWIACHLNQTLKEMGKSQEYMQNYSWDIEEHIIEGVD